MDDIENWKARDPIARLSRSMINENIWSEAEELNFYKQIDNEIHRAWEQAMIDPYPDCTATLKYVYSSI
jgi:TPP-dependent pyruvate/acetoin dehydrogenase alpha subunit